MEQSESIKELAAALSKAQSKFEAAKKSSKNPHFKSNYADLAEVWDAARAALTENGLSVAQVPGILEGQPVLHTQLMHESGEYLRGAYPLSVANMQNPQQLGSALTYARRYAFCAVTGMTADDDDDGNAAAEGAKQAKPQEPNQMEREEFRSLVAEATQLPGLEGDQAKFVTQMHERIGQYKDKAQFTLKQLEYLRNLVASKRPAPKEMQQQVKAIIDDEIRY